MGVIDDIKTNLGKAYTKLETKGATIPEYKNMENLEDTIDSVSVEKETQQKTVGLSMASGDQIVTPDTNKVLSQVTIEKPATLNSENIKKDVNIGGVVGTLEEGITPTGNINITDTNQTDVTNYATAQVVDENLLPENIRSGVSVLGVQGNMQSGITNYQVIDRPNALPTASATTADIVQVGGTNYIKKKVIDLSNTTWLLGDRLQLPAYVLPLIDIVYAINFASNSISYTSFKIKNDYDVDEPAYVLFYDTTPIYGENSFWLVSDAYKTIAITGGNDKNNETLYNWLVSNATLQSGSPVSYKYEQIIYSWVDGQNTTITTTKTTTETSIDMSTFITNYEANGEYEIIIKVFLSDLVEKTASVGSDIMGTTQVVHVSSKCEYSIQIMTIPLKKYLKYQNSSSSIAFFGITLLGYRRIK